MLRLNLGTERAPKKGENGEFIMHIFYVFKTYGFFVISTLMLIAPFQFAQSQDFAQMEQASLVNVRDHLNLVIPDYSIYLEKVQSSDGSPGMAVYVSPSDWSGYGKTPLVEGECISKVILCLQRARLGETNWMFKLGDFTSSNNLNVTEFVPESLINEQARLIENLFSNPSDYFVFRVAAFNFGSMDSDVYIDRYSDFALLSSDQTLYISLVRKDRADNKVYFLYFSNSGFWILDIDEWFPASDSKDLIRGRGDFLDAIESALDLIGN